MRKFLVAVALFASLCTAAIAGPKEEALQVVEKWTKAFTESDVNVIVKLYALDAFFLGTCSNGSGAYLQKSEKLTLESVDQTDAIGTSACARSGRKMSRPSRRWL